MSAIYSLFPVSRSKTLPSLLRGFLLFSSSMKIPREARERFVDHGRAAYRGKAKYSVIQPSARLLRPWLGVVYRPTCVFSRKQGYLLQHVALELNFISLMPNVHEGVVQKFRLEWFVSFYPYFRSLSPVKYDTNFFGLFHRNILCQSDQTNQGFRKSSNYHQRSC